MNENGNEKCSSFLFVSRFGFWCVFPFAVRCLLLLFIALSCFRDRINSISKTKTDKWRLLLVLVFCECFRLSIALLVVAFAGTENQNEQQKAKEVQMETRLQRSKMKWEAFMSLHSLYEQSVWRCYYFLKINPKSNSISIVQIKKILW